MENPQTAIAPTPVASKRWPLFLLGVLLFVAGPVIYFVQFGMKQFVTPWYVPILASVGVLCMLASVLSRFGLLRGALFVLFLLACGGEWFMLLVAMKTPVYAGPAQIGKSVPTFATSLADGKAFATADLKNGKSTILLFFRGRW
jgi:hypothetical protein